MSNTTAAMDAELVVRDVIQRVYGDATQTVLDGQAAREIVKALREMGWASIDDVARLIVAAGGEIAIPHRLLLSSEEYEVLRVDNPMTYESVFTARLRR